MINLRLDYSREEWDEWDCWDEFTHSETLTRHQKIRGWALLALWVVIALGGIFNWFIGP